MFKLISTSKNQCWQLLVSKKSFSLPLLSIIFLFLIDSNAKILAQTQIVPDNTLPSNSVVIPDGNLKQIHGGTAIGSNLFHSFEQFSLSTGDTAWFDNALNINNILGRVTGGSISEIDGLIRANGTANLFLINPNGIVFGENAALDIGGSFLGSTANSLKFADGSEFSAVNPQAPPLLTVNIPLGLQYGTNNGDIIVRGTGNQLRFNPNFTVNRESRPTGLQVDGGQTLALVGGNVFLEGGNLTAEAGKIELGSVGGDGFVKLDVIDSDWNFDYSEVSIFRDINLLDASSLEVSSNGGGNVSLNGREIVIVDGSAILADTLDDLDGKQIEVNASELLVVAGTSADGESFISRLSTDVAPTATGNGGDIELNAGTLIVTDGAQVISSTYGSGNTGNIQVKADDVELVSGSRVAFASGVFTLVWGLGEGGDVDLEASNIFVLDGAEAAALTFGDGAGGNLEIKANNVEIIGTSPGGTSSRFSTNTEGIGDGGNLTIESESLLVTNGGAVQSSVFGSGNGGDITVKATEIELSGGAPGVGASGLFANVESEATGNGGQLTIDTESLLIADGAQAIVATFGNGDAGIFKIVSKEIELIGISPNGFPSGLFSVAGSVGNGGNLNVETNNLQIMDGAQVAVSTSGIGNGGELEITANEIELTGGSEFGASGIFGNAIIGTGDGGNLQINTNNLTILDGATISVSNFSSRNDRPPGQGKAGNIKVEANSLLIDSLASETPSSINASTNTGGGGEITLNVTEGITLNNNSQIVAETQGSGDGGNITITTQNFKLNNQAQVAVNSSGLGWAGDINITANRIDAHRGNITATSTASGGGYIDLNTDFLFLDNNSLISTSVLDSFGEGGDLTINSQYIIALDNSDLRANADLGRGGNIDITTEVILLSLDSDIDASSMFGIDGVVKIQNPELDEQTGIVRFSDEVSDPTDLILAVCPLEIDNVMLTTGKGGLSENPSQSLRGQSFWDDLRDFSSGSQIAKSTMNINKLQTNKSKTIVEAAGWMVNNQGKIQLVSQVPFNQCRY